MNPPAEEVLELLLEAGVLRGTGRSMLPLLRDGDIVRFARDSVIRRGDVVVCRTRAGGAVVHRVLSVAGDRIVLRGDGNPRPDPPFERSQLVGRVHTIVRSGREIDLGSHAMRAYGLFMVALTPAAPWIWRAARLAHMWSSNTRPR